LAALRRASQVKINTAIGQGTSAASVARNSADAKHAAQAAAKTAKRAYGSKDGSLGVWIRATDLLASKNPAARRGAGESRQN